MKYFIVMSERSFGMMGSKEAIALFETKLMAEFYIELLKEKKRKLIALNEFNPYSRESYYSVEEVELHKIDSEILASRAKEFKKFCQEKIKDIDKKIQENLEASNKTATECVQKNEELVREKVKIEEEINDKK